MEKLSLTIDNELLMIERHQLTAEEWFVVRLLLLASSEEAHEEYFIRYFKLPTKPDLREIMVSLQNKGVVLKSYKVPNRGERFYPEDVEFNSNFLKNYFKYSYELGEELFKAYPMSMIVQGIQHSLLNISKKYNSLEEAYFAYGKAIGHNPVKHKRVLELLEWAKDNKLINYGICEFIISQKWTELERLQNGDGCTINYDTVKSL